MKKISMQLKKQKNVLVFLVIIFICGIALGTYFSIGAKESIANTVTNYVLNIKEQAIHFTIPHFTILSLLLVLSFLGLGVPSAIAYLFYEGLSIGFCSSIFSILFGFKGFIYILLFIILTKIPFLVIFYFFFHKLLKITKEFITWIIKKQNKKEIIINQALGCLLFIIIIFIYDLLLDFVGIKIIQMLSFLLN